MQEQQARLGGDRDLDLVGQFQPAATLEKFLGEEDLDVPLEFLLVGLGQPIVDRDVPLDDGEPSRWERLSAEPLATTLLEGSRTCKTSVVFLRAAGGSWCTWRRSAFGGGGSGHRGIHSASAFEIDEKPVRFPHVRATRRSSDQ